MTDATESPQNNAKRPSSGLRKASDKSGRTRAREFAVQALYQYLVGKNTIESIDTFTRDLTGFHKADSLHFDTLLTGCVEERETLEALMSPHLDRAVDEVSPIEHAILLIGAKELTTCLDVPRRVVINECIELAKSFGGTDGHKFVNGVVHAMALQVRPNES
jgi:N utilization substance protein B